MRFAGWRPKAGPGGQWLTALLLGASILWAVFRLERSLSILFGDSNDLYTYYSLWYVFLHRDCADIALRQSLYLPHTWVVLTPLFLLGWPVARAAMLLIDIAAVGFIWWRLGELTGLSGLKRWLLLAFFCSWLSTGLVLGLGNLVLVCLAAVVAAFPYSGASSPVWLTLSAMKQSLIFPIYLQLLIRRPKLLLVPFLVFGLCGLAALWWAQVSIPGAFKMASQAMHSVGGWKQFDHTGLRRLLELFLHGKAVSLANWGIWFVLFGLSMLCLKDSLTKMAALLLLSLLPMYHNGYDLVAAAPALAVFLRRAPLIWPTLMTVGLATDKLGPVERLFRGPLHGVAVALQNAYYPILILIILGGLFYLDLKTRPPADQPASNSTEPEAGPTLQTEPK